MLLRIKVKPGSKTDEITRESDGTLRVKIRAQPVDGKANKYLVEYLAGLLQLPKSSVRLLKGETNQFKTLEIDADNDYVMQRIGASV